MVILIHFGKINPFLEQEERNEGEREVMRGGRRERERERRGWGRGMRREKRGRVECRGRGG